MYLPFQTFSSGELVVGACDSTLLSARSCLLQLCTFLFLACAKSSTYFQELLPSLVEECLLNVLNMAVYIVRRKVFELFKVFSERRMYPFAKKRKQLCNAGTVFFYSDFLVHIMHF